MASVQENWKSLRGGLRMSLIVGVMIILAFSGAAFWWLTSKEYGVLFTDLDPRDAAKIVTRLEDMKVEYVLASGGAEIQVEDSAVHDVRLKLMGSDVPLVGGVGFEIFNDSSFGMTEFSQRINYQRALAGELTRTITSLKEVKYARVHLVMPERGLFQQDDNPPTASIALFLHDGHQPMPNRILGIQRLVAASVPKLMASQVTVTDQNGMTLSQQLHDQESVAAVSGRLQQKRAVEEYLIDKANALLNRNFGVHQALVAIDATIEFNQIKRTREKVLPLDNQNKSGIIRRRETRLGSSGKSSADQGNITTEVEYRLGRNIEQIVETPGKIVRLSVAVMVPQGTNDAQRQNMLELVKMAVGFDGARGDASAIYAMGAPQKTQTANRVEENQPAAVVDRLQPVPAQQHPKHTVSPAKAVTNAPPIEQLRNWLMRLPGKVLLAIAALAGLVIMGLMVLFVRMLRTNKPVEQIELSEADREKALERIQGWLAGADAEREGGVV